jgi:hypothetical protein
MVALRLVLRFLSDILNRHVKVIGFSDFYPPRNLLNDDVPNVCDSWLPVPELVDSPDRWLAQERFHYGGEK